MGAHGVEIAQIHPGQCRIGPAPIFDDGFHLTFGMVVLGGLVFISVGFAQTLKARSYRDRKFGYRTMLRLYRIWFLILLIQPVLGASMTVFDGACAGGGENAVDDVARRCTYDWDLFAPWISASIFLYMLTVVFSLMGRVEADKAAAMDGSYNGRNFIVHRALCLIYFSIALVITVGIITLMLLKNELIE